MERGRARDLGVVIGTYPTGTHNAITDVDGVRVGHATVVRDPSQLQVRPRAVANASSFSTLSKFASETTPAKVAIASRVPARSPPRLCLPVSRPEASGK